MLARQIMSRPVITVSPETSCLEAIKTMLARHIGCLPVVVSGQLVGIVSESDFLRRAELGTEKSRSRWLALLLSSDPLAVDFSRQHGRKIGEIMSPNPVFVNEDTKLDHVVYLMKIRGVSRLPVMRSGEIVGIITAVDFMKALADSCRSSIRALRSDKQIYEDVVESQSHVPWRPSALGVDVKNGIVTLQGEVESAEARTATRVAAENIPGVAQVIDQLVVSKFPPAEEDFGGGDFVSMEERPSTADDEPL